MTAVGVPVGITQPMSFQMYGELPRGTTVLEASAGTGKTFTIAALVTRYVAEGVARMEELLVVSFSRESTRELRERVRERLVRARDGLAEPTRRDPADELLAHLADAPESVIELRRKRLEEGLAFFDAATVATTHGFCQQVMLALGTAGDSDPGVTLVEGLGDLVTEVADDLYLRKWGRPGSEAAELSRDEFRELAMAVATDRATGLLPDPAEVTGTPLLRARIAEAVRAEVERRKRRQNLLDYDDILLRLRHTLVHSATATDACARLRQRYRVVLVDEFQDTDPVQWDILRAAFHGATTLVLIGDPKQAIYGFRGADVHAYLDAVGVAQARATLPTNWRSDAALIRGLDAVFREAALGDPRIRVIGVEAASSGRMVSLGSDDELAPVRLRVLPRDGLALTSNGTARTSEAKDAIAKDLGAEVVRHLTEGRLQPRDGSAEREVQPGDIAVLVRTNRQAQQVQAALREVAVPAVLTGRTSVFATPAAQEWQVLLEALEQPHRTVRVRRAALSCFLGYDATALDAGGDALADDLALAVRGWLRVFEERGVAALFEAVSGHHTPGTPPLQPRILARIGGERTFTDLRHLTQTLHEVSLTNRLGLTALLSWLRRRREEAGRDGGQERSRRLETDAAAVQIVTIHMSKGLEFPVVFVPFAWDGWRPQDPPTAAFHDEAGRRLRDVGGRGSPGWDAHVAAHRQEDVDDELRLAYVALTRAQSRLVMWWAPTWNTPQSPLHRLLFQESSDGVPPAFLPVPSDSAALTTLRERAARSNGGLQVDVVFPPSTLPRWAPPSTSTPSLSLATFGRTLDLSWRRTSYSSLTAAAHENAHSPAVGALADFGSEAEPEQTDDELDTETTREAAVAAGHEAVLQGIASPWNDLPGGASFGTLVHAVLERLVDPGDDDELGTTVATQVARFAPGLDVKALTRAMRTALSTPLGPKADGRTLVDFDPRDRLPELDFELPLTGGDSPLDVEVTLAELVPLWRRHCPAGSLAGYPDALADLAPAPLRGFLTGSIDAVLRVGTGGTARYLVVDYKTNRLGSRDEPLTAWDYRDSAMSTAMIAAHYPLQALLYNVALHRYLRWRQPGYDPDVHLGGSLYLFLRGMCGPDSASTDGSPAGVFDWRPPASLVTATSDLLAGVR